jgi:hypothetical protein
MIFRKSRRLRISISNILGEPMTMLGIAMAAREVFHKLPCKYVWFPSYIEAKIG